MERDTQLSIVSKVHDVTNHLVPDAFVRDRALARINQRWEDECQGHRTCFPLEESTTVLPRVGCLHRADFHSECGQENTYFYLLEDLTCFANRHNMPTREKVRPWKQALARQS
jgi:hypothetical protein